VGFCFLVFQWIIQDGSSLCRKIALSNDVSWFVTFEVQDDGVSTAPDQSEVFLQSEKFLILFKVKSKPLEFASAICLWRHFCHEKVSVTLSRLIPSNAASVLHL
jgi:hypothetical protein